MLLSDRYRALKPIGQGGFGRTFLAVDEYKPSRPHCVIKQFFPQDQGTTNPEKAAALFRQEAVRLDELGQHPQIPELLASFEQEHRQYLVQEFINGYNLAQELQHQGAFNEAQIWQLLHDLLPVLQFVHDHQVIHRDIKPHNIIRRRADSQLVLVDFGASKLATSTSLQRTGTSIGSPEYTAPEQAMGKALFASDLYSLGVTCIHLLTCTRPSTLFDTEEGMWVWRDYLKSPVSEALGHVLDKLLQHATRRRYQSVDEVVQDLPLLSARGETKPSGSRSAVDNSKGTSRSSNQPQFLSQSRSLNWKCSATLTGHVSWVRSVAISPDGQTLASGSGDKTVKLWSLSNGEVRHTLRGHSAWVRSVAISPDGQTLASCSNDQTIRLWHLETGKLRQVISGHTDWVRTVAFNTNGQILASGSHDKTVKLWQVSTGTLLGSLSGHDHWIVAIALDHTGQILASGSQDNTIKLWNLGTGELLHTLAGHTQEVLTVAISPKGQLLASGSADNTLKLWHLDTGKLLRTLTAHENSVNSVAIDSTGQLLISGSQDKTIKLWHLPTGELLQTLSGHAGWIWSVAISPDGQTLASGSWDGTIKIWRCD